MGIFLSLGIRGVTVVSKFLLILVLARLLPIKEVGLYGIVVTSIILSLQLVGLDFYAFNTRELLKVKAKQQVALIRNQWLVHFASYLVIFPCLLLTFVFHVMPWHVAVVFYILLLLEHNAQELDRLLVTLSKPVMANVVMFFRSGIWVLALLLITWFKPKAVSLDMVWWFWIAGDVMALTMAVYILRGLPWAIGLRVPIDFSWIKKGLKVAIIFLLGTACLQLLLYMSRYFIQFMLGLHQVGIFVFFGSLLSVIVTFAQVGIYNFAIPPIIAQFHQDANSLRAAMKKLFFTVMWYALAAAILAGAGIYVVMWFVKQPGYWQHLSVFYLLLIGMLITVVGQVPHYALYISYHERAILVISAITLLIAIAVNLTFIPLWGLTGAALAMIVTMVVLGGTKLCVWLYFFR